MIVKGYLERAKARYPKRVETLSVMTEWDAEIAPRTSRVAVG